MFRTYNVQTCKVQHVVLPRHLKRHSAGRVLLIGQLNVLTVHWAFGWGIPLFSEKMVSFQLYMLSFFLVQMFWPNLFHDGQQNWELTLCLNLHHLPVLHLNSHTALVPKWRDWRTDVTWGLLRKITEMCILTNIFCLTWDFMCLVGSQFHLNCSKDTWFIYHKSHLSSAFKLFKVIVIY